MRRMVCRIAAFAELDDRADAARGTRTRADAGDRDNRLLLEEWEAGSVLLARVTVTATASDPTGTELRAERLLDDVWLERGDPPSVEAQVAEVAPGEFSFLAAQLRESGLAVDQSALEESHLHVQLGERLWAALGATDGP